MIDFELIKYKVNVQYELQDGRIDANQKLILCETKFHFIFLDFTHPFIPSLKMEG